VRKGVTEMTNNHPHGGGRYPKQIDLSFPWSEEFQGDSGVAIKAAQDEPWNIYLPWGDFLFYGTKPEMLVEVRKIVKKATADEQAAQEVK
jgi:hypothetical protein